MDSDSENTLVPEKSMSDSQKEYCLDMRTDKQTDKSLFKVNTVVKLKEPSHRRRNTSNKKIYRMTNRSKLSTINKLRDSAIEEDYDENFNQTMMPENMQDSVLGKVPEEDKFQSEGFNDPYFDDDQSMSKHSSSVSSQSKATPKKPKSKPWI